MADAFGSDGRESNVNHINYPIVVIVFEFVNDSLRSHLKAACLSWEH